MSLLSRLNARLDAVEEFERAPVPAERLKGWGGFLGMFAGEHVAGTEFVIGPLFVAHGVSAVDLVLGLLLGNALAVLSWTFLTAPIAVRERITLYFKLEKICGPGLTKVYSVVNALMFCFLAGSMIAVSATAVGIPFDMPMPRLGDWLPNSLVWVLVVTAVGMATTLVAMLGYDAVSRFANTAAPWMPLVFLAAAIAVLPELDVRGAGDFWRVAEARIWTGEPLPGQSKFGFRHVLFFAWFCNMAMHIGMADLSIFRYAKSWKMGLASAAGMFIGHFLAWLASGILYAAFLARARDQLEFAPGPIAYYAAGLAGAACVVIAGWTTANPTIYRAGLAIQSVFPRFKTWKVTLLVGLVTTLAACFPALVMQLLEFVALYGLVLMPMGAVIVADVYLLPRLGMRSQFADTFQKGLNPAAALGWLLTLGLCLWINRAQGVELFFLGLPGWFIAVTVYTGFSFFVQRKSAIRTP